MVEGPELSPRVCERLKPDRPVWVGESTKPVIGSAVEAASTVLRAVPVLVGPLAELVDAEHANPSRLS